MTARRFTATLEARPRGGVLVRLPFDPHDAWGRRARHDVRGTIGGHGMRGTLSIDDSEAWLELGPAWCRSPEVAAGRRAEVVVEPEPPQLATVASDIAQAIEEDPTARETFGSIATFYRKGFIRWIEEAKQPETRARRIAATVDDLRAGRRERTATPREG